MSIKMISQLCTYKFPIIQSSVKRSMFAVFVLVLLAPLFQKNQLFGQFTSNISASPGSVNVGGIITYTITISGISSRQNNIKITGNIPANTSIVAGSVINVSGLPMTIANSSNPYWTRDSLVSGQTTTVRFQVAVLPTNSANPINGSAVVMSDMETENISVTTTFVSPLLVSTGCTCNNDQTPNNTDGTYSTTLVIKNANNTALPSGLTYTIVSSTNLLNSSKGTLGTPAFLYCNGAGCPTGVLNGQYYLNVNVNSHMTGEYSATVDGPDADSAADIIMANTTCANLYPTLPVIPFAEKNCLKIGLNKFSSDMSVYNTTNTLTPILLPSGFSQSGTDSLVLNNAGVLESNNNPYHELYLIKTQAGCRVSSYDEFKIFRARVASLKNTLINCRDTIPGDSVILATMIDSDNFGTGKFYVNNTLVPTGRLDITGPMCRLVKYTIIDSCGVSHSDSSYLQVTIKPKASFNFASGPGEPVSPTCSSGTSVTVNIQRTSLGPNPVYSVTSNKPGYVPTITPNMTGAVATLPTPPIGNDVQYTICLIESNSSPTPVCGNITQSTEACADTICKKFVVYRDRTDCGANALFTSTCEEYEPAYCQTYTVPAIRLHCDFFDFETPPVLTADITIDQGVLDCDASEITGYYNISFFGINFGPTAGCTKVEDLPFINIVCSVVGFEIFGWKPLGALYDALRCDKCIIEFISAIIGKLAGGDGGGVIVMADTDGDGSFDYLIENRFGFPVNGNFSVPNRVKGGGTIAVRAVGAWVNSPADVCGNFDINSVNILDKIPIGSIPVVGAIIEDILQVAGCQIDVALGVVTDATVKVLNNATPEFFNCNPSGYVFAQTLECEIPVDWSNPVALDGCSDLSLIFRGVTSGTNRSFYGGNNPPDTVSITEPGVYQTAGPIPGSILAPGVYPVTYTAVACNGQPETCTFNVVVTSGNPILECPRNITVSTDVDLCTARVTGLAPYQGIGCSSILNYSYTTPVSNTLVQTTSTTTGTHNVPDGHNFELGTTSITYTMQVDINGDGDYTDTLETQNCVFTITVQDNQDPHAVCLDVEKQLNNLGEGVVYAAEIANQIYLDGGSTDNCTGPLSIKISRDRINFQDSLEFDCADLDQNVILLRVTDSNGNTSYCKSVVKIIDFFEGFVLDLDVPEVCFEPFQDTFDFSPYIVIATPNGPNLSHQNVGTLGPEVIGGFGISGFFPDPGSTNDPGTMTTDGIYTLGTGTGWITISYVLSITEQVNQIDSVSLLTGCFRMVHDVFRVEKLDPIWKGGYMCCDQLPVWLGGANWDGTGDPPIPAGMLSLRDIRGDYPGDVYGEWIGQGVSFVNPDGQLYSGDEFFKFDPMGLDGNYSLTYIVGDEPCEFTYSQEILVTCQDLHVDISDYTVCPANWVEEKQVLTNLDDDDIVVSTTGFAALAADGAHYGGGPDSDPVMDLDSVVVIDGRVVIPGFYAPAVRDKNYEICVTTFQTTPFGCADVFCYTITVQDLEDPDFQNCPKEPIVVDAPLGWCSSFVNFEYPWAYDNCMGLYSKIEQVDTTGFVSGSLFPVGSTILAYTAIDTVGNQNYCELKIIVNDYHTPPDISCPSGVTVSNDLNECSAQVFNIPPGNIADNCIDNATIIYEIKDEQGKTLACGFEDASGEEFPVGTSNVTYSIQDQPLILITEIVQDGMVTGMEVTNFGAAAVDITCTKFVMKDANGNILEMFTLPSNNNIADIFDRPIYPPVIPVEWNIRIPDNILMPGETFIHIFNGDQDGDGDIDVINPVARCDVRRYCFMFLDRTLDEAWINDQIDGPVIVRKTPCDHDLQSDFKQTNPCEPGSFGQLNPGFTFMTPNGTQTGLQNYPPSIDQCNFFVTVNDLEGPTCIWHDTIPIIATVTPLPNPLPIQANTCLTATVLMPPGIVDDVNIYNLKITTANAGAITAYLRSPSGTRIKLFDKVCATDSDYCGPPIGISGFPNINVNLDESIKWTPAPSIINAVCTPSMGAGEIYKPEESFKEFYGEMGGGVWTLEIFGEEGVTGTLTDWDLQILYQIPFGQQDVTLENEPGLCTQEFSWIHPILEDNCCLGEVTVTYDFENDVTNESESYTEVLKNLTGTINMQGCLVTKIFKVGMTTITYNLKDQYGNLNTCGFKVTVIDNENPLFDDPCVDVTINLDPTACFGALLDPPTASDNCDMKGVTFCYEDGSPADIRMLPIGVYNLIAKAEDIYGNITTCTFQVTVIEYIPNTNTLACNDHIRISLGSDCEAMVDADMFLEGDNYRCYDNYCIIIENESGVPHDNLFTYEDEGKTFRVIIHDCLNPSGNTCWGYITIEEKLLPILVCPDDITVTCNTDIEERDSDGNLLTGEGLLESCEPNALIIFQDDWVHYAQCNNPRAKVSRYWSVTDDEGNRAECIQNITILPLSLADVVFPEDIEFNRAKNCEEVLNDPALILPENTGWPMLRNTPVNKTGGLCMVSLFYEDEKYDICEGSYEILRYWKVRNMCLPVTSDNPLVHVQVIKVLDRQPPKVLDCPEDVTVSVNPWNCKASVALPTPSYIGDGCSSDFTFNYLIYGGGYVNGRKVTSNTVEARAEELAKGNYRVKYLFRDNCFNQVSCEFNVQVKDLVPPTPVVKHDIVVSLTPDGNGDGNVKIYTHHVDNGTFDHCGPVRLEIRRETGPACHNMGLNDHNNNSTFNNNLPRLHGDDHANDTDNGEFVSFCCEDLTTGVDIDGDGEINLGYHKVILRAWDDADMNAIWGTAGDNYNDSWAYVKVEDKAPPTIQCPPNTTIYCDWSITYSSDLGSGAQPVDGIDFTKTGLPIGYGTCGPLPIRFRDNIGQLNQCRLGNVTRDFFVGSAPVNQAPSCRQIITILPSTSQQPWVITAPSTTPVSSSCDGPSEDDIQQFGPKMVYGPCDVIGENITVHEFLFENGVCKKWRVEYNYINWCTSEEKGPYFADFIYEDVIAPVLPSCDSLMFSVDANCEHKLILKNSATDQGGCHQEGWLKWTVFIDLWADGTQDWEFSSFLPINNDVANANNGNLSNIKDDNGNGVRDIYVAPTLNGNEVVITVPEIIVGKMSNHKVSWKVTDGCHNFASCHQEIMVVDKKPPTPYCVNLSTSLMVDPDGSGPLGPMVELWAIDFNVGSFDNCTPQEELIYTFDSWSPQVTDTIIAGKLININVAHYFDDKGAVMIYPTTNAQVLNRYNSGEIQLWIPTQKSSAKIWPADVLPPGAIKGDVDVMMSIWDSKFNSDFCWVKLSINCTECMDIEGGRIAGIVATTSGQGVNNVTVSIDRNAIEYPRAMNTQNGFYSFGNIHNSMFGSDVVKISALKNDGYANGVSTLDLVLIQRHILGIQSFTSPYKVIASDVNDDTKINSIDLVELRKVILGTSESFPNKSWRFPMPDLVSLQDIFPFKESHEILVSGDMTGNNFTAVKIGDINGDATLDIVNPVTDTRGNKPLHFVTTEQVVKEGDVIHIPVTSSNFKEVFGFQFTMNYANAEYIDVIPGKLNITDANVGIITDKKITMSFASEYPESTESNEVLFTFVLKARQDGLMGNMLELNSEITRAESYLGSAMKQQGVSWSVQHSIDGQIVLFQNEPNPFRERTVISFYLPTENDIILKVFDVTGRLLNSRSLHVAKGYHVEVYTREQLSGSGIYYYQLECGEFTEMRKMIMID